MYASFPMNNDKIIPNAAMRTLLVKRRLMRFRKKQEIHEGQTHGRYHH